MSDVYQTIHLRDKIMVSIGGYSAQYMVTFVGPGGIDMTRRTVAKSKADEKRFPLTITMNINKHVTPKP